MAVSSKALSIVEEFKSFAFKGNVVDLAVGVIIGGAFGKIVDSLVKSDTWDGSGSLMAKRFLTESLSARL